MQVAADGWEIPHRGNHPRRDMTRMRTGESDSREPLDFVEALKETSEVAAWIVGRLIMIHDLPEKLHFPRALCDGLSGFCHDVGRGSHSLVAARVRHDTERAVFVAALDDRHVRLHRIAPARYPQRKRHIVYRIH